MDVPRGCEPVELYLHHNRRRWGKHFLFCNNGLADEKTIVPEKRSRARLGRIKGTDPIVSGTLRARPGRLPGISFALLLFHRFGTLSAVLPSASPNSCHCGSWVVEVGNGSQTANTYHRQRS